LLTEGPYAPHQWLFIHRTGQPLPDFRWLGVGPPPPPSDTPTPVEKGGGWVVCDAMCCRLPPWPSQSHMLSAAPAPLQAASEGILAGAGVPSETIVPTVTTDVLEPSNCLTPPPGPRRGVVGRFVGSYHRVRSRDYSGHGE